jgi:hypothetical protein
MSPLPMAIALALMWLFVMSGLLSSPRAADWNLRRRKAKGEQIPDSRSYALIMMTTFSCVMYLFFQWAYILPGATPLMIAALFVISAIKIAALIPIWGLWQYSHTNYAAGYDTFGQQVGSAGKWLFFSFIADLAIFALLIFAPS